ncbi:hypothetical protein F442_03870 [Phytophthora nicotianae P10297]|uniref:Retrotransposon gag domain-containing protein n=1 Tax=Phytophthora nicotianae P10297 TaxID=1317064 RepID=W2ZV52_PHYNI|nr:hypothetical protein F442_03870 [Phytophthora nicotianae P10297]
MTATHVAVPAQDQAQQGGDDLGSMDWWDQLTPAQQRAMMKRFLIQPLAPAPPQPVVVQAPAPVTPVPRRKMKTLHLEDFYGTTGESIEAWLATIPQEVERQAGLGGDTWTAEELYYGVTAHLKDSAGKWFTTLSETMQDDDKTLSYLVRRLRQKYGSRDNLFKTQQKLAAREQQAGERLSEFAAHLTNIGFGKRVPAESYVEAFINGINNPTTATQVRAYEPQTLDALQFAEDKCGLYGEGFNVTDWRVAKRRYREDRELGDDEEEAPPPKRRTSTAAALEQLHWKKLGFGLGGGDSPPKFDDGGNEVSDLERTAKKDPLSMAALQALILTSGMAREETHGLKQTTGKQKDRALEIKAEVQQKVSPATEEKDNQQHGTVWPPRNSGGFNGGHSFSGGRGFNGGRGSGSGRGGLEHYGPRTIQQHESTSRCGYCNKIDHWWRECRARIAELGEQGAPQQQQQPVRANVTGSSTGDTPAEVETLLFAIDEHPAEEGGQSGVLTRTGRKNARRKRRWVALRGSDGGADTESGRVQGKNSDSGGQKQGKSGGPGDEKSSAEVGECGAQNESDTERKRKEGESAAEPVASTVVAEPGSVAGERMVGESVPAVEGNKGGKKAVEQKTVIPRAVIRQALPLSNGRTAAAKRRQAEEEVAAMHGVLAAELRIRREERATVLRVQVKQLISELRERADIQQQRKSRREAHLAATAVRKAEEERQIRTSAVESRPEELTEGAWMEEVARNEENVPKELPGLGSLTEMRTVRRRALKAAKRFRAANRRWRLQPRRETQLQNEGRGRDGWKRGSRPVKPRYKYVLQGCYGDVELRDKGDGRQARVAQLRAIGSGNPSSLYQRRCWHFQRDTRRKLDWTAVHSSMWPVPPYGGTGGALRENPQ